MKKIVLCTIISLFFLNNIFAQYNTKDSIWFEGKYYSQEEFKIAKAEHDRLNYSTYFMPGLAFSFYQPKQADSIGNFSGLTVEYLLFANIRQNNDPGPSHVRMYAKLNILTSTKENINSMFMYTLGLDLSLEKNPKRTFLIPYFGIEFGGMSQKQFGTILQFTPTLGVHLISKKNIFINLHGGYVYPISDFETLQGWITQAGVNFALW